MELIDSIPIVWMSNVYSNNGVQTASFPRGGTATFDPTSNPALVTATQPQCVKDTIAALILEIQ